MAKGKVKPELPSVSSLVSSVSWTSTRRPRIYQDLLQVILTAIIIILLLLIIIMIIPKDEADEEKVVEVHQPVPDDNVCYSSECIHAAGDILQSIEQSLDPCDDFFKFSCQKWIDDNVLIDGKESKFNDRGSLMYWRTKELMEEPLMDGDAEHVTKTKKMYKSCMDKSHIDILGNAPLLADLEELGGYPVVQGDSWDESKFDLVEMTHKLYFMGLAYSQYLSFSMYRHVYNSSQIIFDLDEGIGPLKNSQMLLEGLANRRVHEYLKLIQSLAVELGADPDVAKSEMLEVLGFETFLENISMPDSARSNMTTFDPSFITTLRKLNVEAPQFNWTKLIQGFMPDYQVTEDFSFVVVNMNYFKLFAEKIQAVDKRILANFLVTRAVLKVSIDLGYDMRSLYNRYAQQVLGKSASIRLITCTSLIRHHFSHSVSNLYLKKFFSKEAKIAVSELVDNIRDVFEDNLQGLEWMDEQTKNAAKRKLEHMYALIGYDDELMDDDILNSYYAELEIAEDKFYRNQRNALAFRRKMNMKQIVNPHTKNTWKENEKIFISNAFYSPSTNAIQITAAIADTYNPKKPRYTLFGNLGTVVGHEIIHGYDDSGSTYDHEGNLIDWWNNNTWVKFKQKTECLKHQYNSYEYQGIAINGHKTLGENIADNGGIKQAYQAYQEWKQENGDEPSLPGLKFNSNQMFWLTYSTARCAEYSTEYLEQVRKKHVHAPYPARINIPLSNYEKFAEDFNCPIGTTMNPEKKCSVW